MLHLSFLKAARYVSFRIGVPLLKIFENLRAIYFLVHYTTKCYMIFSVLVYFNIKYVIITRLNVRTYTYMRII